MNPRFVAFRFAGNNTSLLRRLSTSTITSRIRKEQQNFQFSFTAARYFAYTQPRCYSSSMAATPSESLQELSNRVQSILPDQFRKDAWYLIVASALVGCGKPTEVGPLYSSLVESVDEAEEKRIKQRLSDVLMKEWTLVGIPPVVYAVTALGKAETALYEKKGIAIEPQQPSEDGLLEFPEKRKNIDFNNEIPDRGTKFLQQLYRQNLAPICSSWGSFANDFMWMERSVIYGLFLSDHEVLSPVEAELVILTSIMTQGLGTATIWHLRGLRRLGVSEADTESVQQAVEAVATWSGRSIEGWPRVKDVGDLD